MGTMAENCLERMERIDGKRKIADFIVKQKQDYSFKVHYAAIRAREFVEECDVIIITLGSHCSHTWEPLHFHYNYHA